MYDHEAETAYNLRLRAGDNGAANWWYDTGRITIDVARKYHPFGGVYMVVMTPYEACQRGYSDQVLKWVREWIEDMDRVEQIL